jgi:hypothetical protein
MDKNEIIRNIYYNPMGGFGSVKNTFKEAKSQDKTITFNDVKAWFNKNVETKVQLKGYNSWVSKGPKEEYQTDLVFFPRDIKDKKYYAGLVMIDTFSKSATVVPLVHNDGASYLETLKTAFEKMGGKPKSLYSDIEGALTSKVVVKYLNDENVRVIFTRNHAPVVERFNRTLKKMINDRISAERNRDGGNIEAKWTDVVDSAIATYNLGMVHSATKMTPTDAKKPQNQLKVKMHLELQAKRDRKYPPVEVGDRVRCYRKKDKLDKEHISVWEPTIHRVEAITEFMQQPFYKISGKQHDYTRSEILLVG